MWSVRHRRGRGYVGSHVVILGGGGGGGRIPRATTGIPRMAVLVEFQGPRLEEVEQYVAVTT
jgi:hypothetical protein